MESLYVSTLDSPNGMTMKLKTSRITYLYYVTSSI